MFYLLRDYAIYQGKTVMTRKMRQTLSSQQIQNLRCSIFSILPTCLTSSRVGLSKAASVTNKAEARWGS